MQAIDTDEVVDAIERSREMTRARIAELTVEIDAIHSERDRLNARASVLGKERTNLATLMMIANESDRTLTRESKP